MVLGYHGPWIQKLGKLIDVFCEMGIKMPTSEKPCEIVELILNLVFS